MKVSVGANAAERNDDDAYLRGDVALPPVPRINMFLETETKGRI